MSACISIETVSARLPVGLRGRTRACGGGARGSSESLGALVGLPARAASCLTSLDSRALETAAHAASDCDHLFRQEGLESPTHSLPAQAETAWLGHLRPDPFICDPRGTPRPDTRLRGWGRAV
jgi:hypothetical protein